MKSKIKGHSAHTIFESIRQLVKQGELTDQQQLPSVRALAEELSVNRNTVSAAYQKLVVAGLAKTQGRLGTQLCLFNQAGEQEGTTNTNLFDLADGSPRIDWLPTLNKVAADSDFIQYGYGEQTLLERIHQYGSNWFTKDIPNEFDIALTNGAIDAMERIFSAHLVPGDTVIVEDPCYISAANAIRTSGLKVSAVPIDKDGMCPLALKTALQKGAQAVLITPRAHNPTGVSLSKTRALELKSVLADFPNTLVLIDDHFALMSYEPYFNVIPNTMRSWAVFRSVSKGFGPDLRLAILAGDSETIQSINARLAPGMSWVSRVLQSMVYTCLTSNWVQEQLTQAKQDCANRRRVLVNALIQNGLPRPISIDGLNIWLNIPGDAPITAFELSKKGWLVRPCNAFDIQRNSQALRVSIPKIDKDIAERFAQDIYNVTKKSQR